jgi:hypothetical protein
MENGPIVIVDDNPRTREKLLRKIGADRGNGVWIETASSRLEGEKLVRDLLKKGVWPEHILSDLSMGRAYELRKQWDGYKFAKWCLREGIHPENITLHSTAFERGNVWKPMHNVTTIRWARKLGIRTQGKATTLGIERPRKPRRK